MGEGWQGLSEREAKDLEGLMDRSCKKGSWAIIDRKLGVWQEYLGTRENGKVLGEYLLGASSDAIRLSRVAHFASWLNSEKGLRGRALTSIIGAVKTQFESHGIKTDWWEDNCMDRIRVAAKPTTAEAKEDRLGSKNGMRLPISEEMLARCRLEMWEGNSHGEDIDCKARWLAIALGFDSGPRVGQLTKREKNCEDHAIRAGQVTYVFQGGSSLVAGWELRKKLIGLRGDYSSVDLVDIEYVTGKTSGSQSYVVKRGLF